MQRNLPSVFYLNNKVDHHKDMFHLTTISRVLPLFLSLNSIRCNNSNNNSSNNNSNARKTYRR